MNELEQTYKDKIDFIKYDVTTQDGYCELTRQNFSGVPSMIFIDRNGKTVYTATSVIEKEALKQKLDEILKR